MASTQKVFHIIWLHLTCILSIFAVQLKISVWNCTQEGNLQTPIPVRTTNTSLLHEPIATLAKQAKNAHVEPHFGLDDFR